MTEIETAMKNQSNIDDEAVGNSTRASQKMATTSHMDNTHDSDRSNSPKTSSVETCIDASSVSEYNNHDNKSKTCISSADATGEFTRGSYTHEDHKLKSSLHPQVTPCSLDPTYWPKRRIRVTTIGCLTSVIVCIVRLLANHDSTAYIIHSFIVFFDLILIHIFTYTPWLSIAGESTAIVFATTFYFTEEKVFELLETTLIAVFVSFHMIQSRDEHWGREEGLERDVIGLQLHIEQFLVQHDVSVDGQLRRYSSLSLADERNSTGCNVILEEADLEVGARNNVHLDAMSSIHSPIYATTAGIQKQQLQQRQEDANDSKSGKLCCKIAFEHFLDGSAGVLYTSFIGLILDEIINFGTDKYQK